jgi:predicted transglutaminase-like cysteine proteinase
MSNLKEKATETAEHMVNVVTETVGKVGHAASEALHKGEHALTDMARKAVGLAPEATDKLKEVGNKVAGKAQNGVAAGEMKVKDAADKIKEASAKTKNDVN